MNLSYIPAMPASGTVKRGEPLNVLSGCVNREGRDLVLRMSVWGRTTGDWKELCSRREEVLSGEHYHIYLTVPAECFDAEYWDGEEPEEMEITVFHEKPPEDASGTMIFITD